MVRPITKAFEGLRSQGRKAFIPFITAGDPDLETTIRIVPELEHAGSAIVELGIPFSDPMADGPVIQRASERALRHGYRMSDFIEAIRRIRRDSAVPIVLFSYFNPILQYGLEDLAGDAHAAGVNGILATDMTPEEGSEYCACLERHELDPIFLVAPTTSPQRIGQICDSCRGFVYVVSRMGVTGMQESVSDTVGPMLVRVRERSALPVAVGFGISSPEQVQAIWQVADGAVVGSAIVAEIEKARDLRDLPMRVGAFCRWLTGGADVA